MLDGGNNTGMVAAYRAAEATMHWYVWPKESSITTVEGSAQPDRPAAGSPGTCSWRYGAPNGAF
jgi:hypothetical protein